MAEPKPEKIIEIPPPTEAEMAAIRETGHLPEYTDYSTLDRFKMSPDLVKKFKTADAMAAERYGLGGDYYKKFEIGYFRTARDTRTGELVKRAGNPLYEPVWMEKVYGEKEFLNDRPGSLNDPNWPRYRFTNLSAHSYEEMTSTYRMDTSSGRAKVKRATTPWRTVSLSERTLSTRLPIRPTMSFLDPEKTRWKPDVSESSALIENLDRGSYYLQGEYNRASSYVTSARDQRTWRLWNKFRGANVPPEHLNDPLISSLDFGPLLEGAPITDPVTGIETKPSAAYEQERWTQSEWTKKAVQDPYERLGGTRGDPYRWLRSKAKSKLAGLAGKAGTALALGLTAYSVYEGFRAAGAGATTLDQSPAREKGPISKWFEAYSRGFVSGGPAWGDPQEFERSMARHESLFEAGKLVGVVGSGPYFAATGAMIAATEGVTQRSWGVAGKEALSWVVAPYLFGKALQAVGWVGGKAIGAARGMFGRAPSLAPAIQPAAQPGWKGAFSQWRNTPLYGPEAWWNPVATRGKAVSSAMLASKVMSSPWLDPRNMWFTGQSYMWSDEEAIRRGVSPAKTAQRREESTRWFIGSAITGAQALTGGEVSARKVNWIQTDPGEALANYGPGTAINAEMALGFIGKGVERKDIKGSYGRPGMQSYPGGNLAGAIYGMVRPAAEYLLTMNVVDRLTGGFGGWAAAHGVGRMNKAAQAFEFGLMSPNEPTGYALGWTFAGRSKGPQRLLLGTMMGLGAMATNNVEAGEWIGRTAYSGLWATGTVMSMINAGAVNPNYRWPRGDSEASMLRAVALNRFAQTRYENTGWWEKWGVSKQDPNRLPLGSVTGFLSTHFSMLTTGAKYMQQVLGGGVYNPLLRGRTVGGVWTPTQIEAYMWGEKDMTRLLPSNEEVSLSAGYAAASYLADPRISKSLTAQAMSVTPGYVPFSLPISRKEELTKSKYQYYVSKGEFGEQFYLKQGQYYDRFAPGRKAVGAEADLLIGERPLGSVLPFTKVPDDRTLSKDDFIKHTERLNQAIRVEGETPGFKLKSGKIEEERKTPGTKPAYSSLIGFRYLAHEEIPEEVIKEAMDVTVLMEKDLYGGGGGRGRRFYPPDPIEMVKGSVSGWNPFGDNLIMAAIGDSIQEWNVRSPRRGGEPYMGDWD